MSPDNKFLVEICITNDDAVGRILDQVRRRGSRYRRAQNGAWTSDYWSVLCDLAYPTCLGQAVQVFPEGTMIQASNHEKKHRGDEFFSFEDVAPSTFSPSMGHFHRLYRHPVKHLASSPKRGGRPFGSRSYSSSRQLSR